MKAGGNNEGDFRELSGSLASAFRLGFIVVSFLLFYTMFCITFRGTMDPGHLCSSDRSRLLCCTTSHRFNTNVDEPTLQPSRSSRSGFAAIYERTVTV